MNESNITKIRDYISSITRPIGSVVGLVVLISAFEIYGAKGGFLVLLVLGPLTLLASLTGMVPVAGPFIYWQLQRQVVATSFFGWFPQITSTWVTELLFWNALVLSVLFTVVTTLVAYARLRDS